MKTPHHAVCSEVLNLPSQVGFASWAPPWLSPIASPREEDTRFYGCWLKTGVQHHVHSRVNNLYH